jgi:hypothetical protein
MKEEEDEAEAEAEAVVECSWADGERWLWV